MTDADECDVQTCYYNTADVIIMLLMMSMFITSLSVNVLIRMKQMIKFSLRLFILRVRLI